nr:hypothetical protein [Candidatus Freyarchaeota archaeon]
MSSKDYFDEVANQWDRIRAQKVVVDCVGENCCAQSSCGCKKASISIFTASCENEIN